MRKICIFLLMAFSLFNGVNAKEVDENLRRVYSYVTNDERVIEALELLKGTTGEYSRKAILGKNLTGIPIKVKFERLSKLSKNAKYYDALGMKRGSQLYIFINKKHKNAPTEALAALLSHEALHQDLHNSKNEETYAWNMEALVWHELKKSNPEIANQNHPLVARENNIERKLKDANFKNVNLRRYVENHNAYKGLPKQSPGFEYVD